MGAATAGTWLLAAGSVFCVSIASVSRTPSCAAVEVETRFGAVPPAL